MCFHSERISLYGNNIFSTIPTELGQLSDLELLDLGSNRMTGSIPTTLGLIGGLGKNINKPNETGIRDHIAFLNDLSYIFSRAFRL
jgi:hypothetical protein